MGTDSWDYEKLSAPVGDDDERFGKTEPLDERADTDAFLTEDLDPTRSRSGLGPIAAQPGATPDRRPPSAFAPPATATPRAPTSGLGSAVPPVSSAPRAPTSGAAPVAPPVVSAPRAPVSGAVPVVPPSTFASPGATTSSTPPSVFAPPSAPASPSTAPPPAPVAYEPTGDPKRSGPRFPAPSGPAPSGPPSAAVAVAPAAGVAPSPPLGPAPEAPPRRYRPEVAVHGAPVAPPATLDGPEHGYTNASPAPVRPSPGWGWRALIAFLAGGLLTGGGFAVGQLTLGDDGQSTETAAEVTTTIASPTPTVTGPIATTPTLPPPTGDIGAEPALFVADVLGPSVVQIETDFGIGSGVIYGDGLVMTNNHVVEGARTLSVLLSDGRRLSGEIVGTEPNVDIAVVSVGEGQDLPVAALATDERARVGQVAIAIGSPFRLQQTVTEGIVSAVSRPIRTGDIFTAMIQTDAPINPGNSGGALADIQGRVIGINTAIQTDGLSNTNAGIGFAIPIDTALSVAERLVAGVEIESGFLGIHGVPSPDGAAGVVVDSVTENSSAAAAGIVIGDRIVSFDGAPLTQFEELAGLVVAQSPGDVVVIELFRDGALISVEATLGSR